jgi:hypothetical protein
VSMDTDERLSQLEQLVGQHEHLIAKLIAYAKLTAGGRLLLKALGIS